LHHAQQMLIVASNTYPALPPPVPLLREVAARNSNPALVAKIEASAKHCKRSDCFRRELGW